MKGVWNSYNLNFKSDFIDLGVYKHFFLNMGTFPNI